MSQESARMIGHIIYLCGMSCAYFGDEAANRIGAPMILGGCILFAASTIARALKENSRG